MKCSNMVINITPHIFLIPPIEIILPKLSENICHHKMLATFQIKSLHCNRRGGKNHVQFNYFHI